MSAQFIAENGPKIGQTFDFSKGDEWIIGSSKDADFVIEGVGIARKQIRITRTKDGIFVENLNKAHQTLVNDAPITELTRLNDGDRVQIDHQIFLFQDEKKKEKGGYEDIFGDLQTPVMPPEPEPVEEAVEKTIEPAAEETAPPPPAEKEIAKTAYDTIFEDVPEMEIPPETPESPLVLKVIGGPNAGAEIGLEKGRSYTIGKDPDSCDIIFQDVSVSRNHARLTITPDGILELEDLGSKNGTTINNITMTERRAITSQDSVAMGTTIFMILDREEAQETVVYAPKPVYEAPKVVETAAPVPEVAPKEKDWKSMKIPGKHLIFAGSFLAILLIMFLSFFSLFKAENMQVAVKEPHEHIKDALVKFPGVQYSFNPASGKLFLAGHILTAVDYQEMRYNLTQIPMITSTDDNVVIDEYVWKTMTDVLTSNAGWRGVNIVSPEAGRFLVHGYVQSQDQSALLSDYLNVNFPYPDRLQNKVIVEDTLSVRIQSLLQAKGFSGVTFQLSVGDLILAGRYSEKQEEEYKDLIGEMNKIEGIQSVKNFAVASLPSQASIDLTQQYKVTGSSMHENQGFSAIINGRIFTLGDALDGMKISAIEPNSILLEKDGLKYKIDFTR